MPRDLPSLNALRVFDSAARHLNFSRAADELNVTQSAVSRQIKLLESQLEQPLFVRAGPKLTLTTEGGAYQRQVAEALAILRRATAELHRARATPSLTVSVLPTFAAKWLVPRLTEFEHNNPEIAVRLAAAHRVIDFANEPDIDVAIRMGLGGWPGVQAIRLTALHIFPACSPGVARRLNRPADLASQRLLADDSLEDEWPRWFKAAGLEYRAGDIRNYDDDSMLLQAAIAGQGVTLARTVNAQDDLDAGRLVRPFDVSVLSAFQYHFVCPVERLEDPNVRAFRDWLQRALR